jgi:hypothetical protein
MKFSLWIISFMVHAFCFVLQKSSTYQRSSRFYPVLSPTRVMVLHFAFSSIVHFEFHFLNTANSMSAVAFYACGHWVDREPLAKRTVFPVVLPLLPCQRSVDATYVGLFLGFLFCSIVLFVYFFTNISQSDYSSFRVGPKVRYYQFPNFILSLNIE